MRIDRAAMAVYVDGEECYLSPARFRVLCLLAENAGQVVSHRDIASAGRGGDLLANWYSRHLCADRSRNLVHYIRRALGDAVTIRERRGIGYRLEA